MAISTLIRALIVAAVTSTMVLADSYPVVLTAHSPTLEYLPGIIFFNKTGAPAGVWNQTYTGVQGMLDGNGRPPSSTGYDNIQGANGLGMQLMWASGSSGDNAASVKYSFTGTGIMFRGYWSEPSLPGSADASVELVIDGRSTIINGQAGGVQQLVTLAENTALSNGHHEVQLFVRSGAVSIMTVEPILYFENISMATITQGEAAALEQSNIGAEQAGDTDNSPSIMYGVKHVTESKFEVNPALQFDPGSWVEVPNLIFAGWQYVGTNAVGYTLTIPIGSGNFFVRLNGTLQPRCDYYKIAISPAPPHGAASILSTAFSSPWTGNATLYMAALDPNQEYNITVENTPVYADPNPYNPNPDQLWTGIHAIELWKGSSSGDTVSSSVATTTTVAANGTTITIAASSATSGTVANNATSGASNNGTATVTNSTTIVINNSSGGETNGPMTSNGNSDNTAAGSTEAKKSNNVAAIAGSVVGGVVGLALIGVLSYFLGRKSSKAKEGSYPKESDIEIEDNSSTARLQIYPKTMTESSSMPPEHLTPARASPAHLSPRTASPVQLMPAGFPAKMSQPPVDSQFLPHHAESPSEYSSDGWGSYPLSKFTNSPITPTTDAGSSTFLSSVTMPSMPSASRARPESIVDQEEDAGALEPVPHSEQPRRTVVPPRYNPEWAVASQRRQASSGDHGSPTTPWGNEKS